jgi:hypothetical protein
VGMAKMGQMGHYKRGFDRVPFLGKMRQMRHFFAIIKYKKYKS